MYTYMHITIYYIIHYINKLSIFIMHGRYSIFKHNLYTYHTTYVSSLKITSITTAIIYLMLQRVPWPARPCTPRRCPISVKSLSLRYRPPDSSRYRVPRNWHSALDLSCVYMHIVYVSVGRSCCSCYNGKCIVLIYAYIICMCDLTVPNPGTSMTMPFIISRNGSIDKLGYFFNVSTIA